MVDMHDDWTDALIRSIISMFINRIFETAQIKKEGMTNSIVL